MTVSARLAHESCVASVFERLSVVTRSRQGLATGLRPRPLSTTPSTRYFLLFYLPVPPFLPRRGFLSTNSPNRSLFEHHPRLPTSGRDDLLSSDDPLRPRPRERERWAYKSSPVTRQDPPPVCPLQVESSTPLRRTTCLDSGTDRWSGSRRQGGGLSVVRATKPLSSQQLNPNVGEPLVPPFGASVLYRTVLSSDRPPPSGKVQTERGHVHRPGPQPETTPLSTVGGFASRRGPWSRDVCDNVSQEGRRRVPPSTIVTTGVTCLLPSSSPLTERVPERRYREHRRPVRTVGPGVRVADILWVVPELVDEPGWETENGRKIRGGMSRPSMLR